MVRSDYAPAHDLLGLIALESGDLDAAAEHFGDAAALAPERAPSHVTRGEACRRRGRWGEAMTAFARAVRAQPDMPEAVFNLGLLLYGTGEVRGALPCLERSARLRPGDASIANRLALVRKELGRKTPSKRAAS